MEQQPIILQHETMQGSWVLTTLVQESLYLTLGLGLWQVSNETERSILHTLPMRLLGLLPTVTLCIGLIGASLVRIHPPPLTALQTNVSIKLDYVLFQVVFTLATVETSVPGGVGTEKVSLLGDPQAQSKRSDETINTSSRDCHVSSSLRTTLRHLQSEAGDMSMFRGIGADLAMMPSYGLLASVTRVIFEFLFRGASRSAETASTVATSLLMAQLEATWLHIIVSKPRQKFWFRRLPLTFFSVLRILSIPVVCAALAPELLDWTASAVQSLNFFRVVGTNTSEGKIAVFNGPPVTDLSLSDITWIILRVTSLLFLGRVCSALVTIPLNTIGDGKEPHKCLDPAR